MRLVLSCEHGGARVPARYAAALRGARAALATHRGQDAGALVLARELARDFDAPLFACTTTRLLVDPNRSLGNPALFSAWTRLLPPEEREAIVARWWRPHRVAVEGAVVELLGAGRSPRGARSRTVLHVSVHSFTPRFRGRPRPIDVALLYDPAREREAAFARVWLGALRARRADLRLRRNSPYRGDADGLTTHLRRRFDERSYLGLELEVSQRFPRGAADAWRALRADVRASLADALAETAAGAAR